MTRRVSLRSSAFVAAGVLSLLAALTVSAAGSRAAVIGTLTFSPATGDDTTTMTVDTSGPCLQGSNFQVYVTGAGLPADGAPFTASTPVGALAVNGSGGYTVTLTDTMNHVAAAQSPPALLTGSYGFSGRCTDSTGATVYDSYAGSLDYTQNGTAAPTYVATISLVFGNTTATALAASPSGPVNVGVLVAFTAHVSSSPTGGALGTVQLMDGTDPIGSPTTVDGDGNAVISSAFTTAGDHSVTASFTGKFGFISDSVSLPLVYTVNATPADATATALAVAPSAPTTADQVTLTASVADLPHPSSVPAGTVQFADGGSDLGGPVTLDEAGHAILVRTFAAGDHSFTAAFVPTDPALFDPSASTSQALTIDAAAGSQPIETTVDPGSLTISISDTSTVVLSSPTLNATATFLTTAGALHPVTVTDTRAGNPGWTLSGQVSDFTSVSGGVVPGADLGWSPTLVDSSQGQTVVPGSRVLPATPPVVADPAHAGSAGLQASRMLASTAPGSGTGTAQVGAELSLDVPTSVPAGVYEATLTLTAI